MNWDMSNVLPPQAGLTIGGIAYSYTVDKIREDEFTVTVRNEDRFYGGYALSYTDDWTDISGSTLVRSYDLPDILIDRLGDGSVVTEGTGTLSDVSVNYTYRYDDCFNPISDPKCPGYAEAYLAYLFANGLIDLDGPDYDPMEE